MQNDTANRQLQVLTSHYKGIFRPTETSVFEYTYYFSRIKCSGYASTV